MTAKQQPTNNDIFKALGALDEKIDAVHDQVKRTNGRVSTLEKKQYARELIEQYVKDEGLKTPQEKDNQLSAREKWMTATITSLIALVGFLIGTGKI